MPKLPNYVFGNTPKTDSMRVAYAEILIRRQFENSYIAANPSPFGWILENERLSDYDGQIILKFWGKKMDDSLWQKICQLPTYLTSNNGFAFITPGHLCQYFARLARARQTIGWKDIASSPDLGTPGLEQLITSAGR